MAGKIAVQMFTVREFCKTRKDLAESLKKISDIGFKAVQVSGVGCMNGSEPEVSAEEARKMLDDNGLEVIATHRPWGAYLESLEAEVDFLNTLGCKYAAIGGIPADIYGGHTAKGYRKWLQDAAPVIKRLAKEGIQFGHHNHSHEFARVPGENIWLEDIVIDESDPSMMLELDLYWVEHAGLNCTTLLKRCAGRVPVIHLKDKEVSLEDGPVIAPIGEGNMDWDGIIPACEDAGVKWYAIEQDQCRRDPFDCLKSSYDFLLSKGLEV